MTRYTATIGGGDGITTDNRDLETENEEQQVYLWDMGPEKPIMPKRPVPPRGKEGEGEYELAMVDFKVEIEAYGRAMIDYRAQTIEFERFTRQQGGPIEIQRWSVDATDALARDAAAVKDGRQTKLRYCISSRTRGYRALPNLGLPAGMKPGHGHAENLRRQREGEEEFEAIRKADPFFGSEVLGA